MDAGSSEAQTESTVNGVPSTICYKRNGADNSGLTWAEGYKGSALHSSWTTIAAKDIIGISVLPETTGEREYNLLYVQPNSAVEQDPKASPLTLHCVKMTNPPLLAVNDFTLIPPEGSCWFPRQVEAKSKPNCHVIVSTGSGTGQAGAFWSHVVKPLLDCVHLFENEDFSLHFTASESSVSEIARTVLLSKANTGVTQSIALMSGDGGLLDIVNALISSERSKSYQGPNIALLPLGTGNALAHSAGITQDSTFGLRSWLRGRLQALPLFRATFSPGARYLYNEAREEKSLDVFEGVPTAHGAVVCSWAMHAGLVADSDTTEYRRFGRERFAMAAKEALFPNDGSQPHAYKGKVSILTEDGEWQMIGGSEHAYVLATYMNQLEKGFVISPDSRPLDGKLRLVHFGPMRGEDAMEVMSKAFRGGEHVKDDRVAYREVIGLRIDFDEDEPRWRRICVDGKIVRVEQGGWVECRVEPQNVVDLVVPLECRMDLR